MTQHTGITSEVICITHAYDIGDQREYVRRVSGEVDAKRAALFCQFSAEEWFGESTSLSNQCIASALVSFYGFVQTAPGESAKEIDMHFDREAACGNEYRALVSDEALHREGLRSFIEPYV